MSRVKERKRGRNKKSSQAEKLLTILLSGNEVTIEEITKTLHSQIELYRLSTYLYDLKLLGAKIEKKKEGRKLSALRLINVDEMREYYGKRTEEFTTRKIRTPKEEDPVLVGAATFPKEVPTIKNEDIEDDEPPTFIIDNGF